MKAVVFHDIGDIRLDDVPAPKLKQPTDAIVRLTASAICGTDLHMIRGTMTGMKSGTILGHEGVGIVEEIGRDVRNLKPGERVVIPSTVACGYCSYCRDGEYSQCDNANPNGRGAGTLFFGSPESNGGLNGLQAEKARIPFANVGLIKLPDEVSDDQAILLSDIFPTGYMAAELADIKPGRTVAVFGCGPVGQFVIASLKLLDAGRIFAVDCIPSRLEMARAQGAEVIDFTKEDPVEAIKALTGGIGVDRAVDAVEIDATAPHEGPAAKQAKAQKEDFEQQLQKIAPKTKPSGGNWQPGDAPGMVFTWAIEVLPKPGSCPSLAYTRPPPRHSPLARR
jgi:threonine dehydrogenase-like Zn-dependent dehydrogenase